VEGFELKGLTLPRQAVELLCQPLGICWSCSAPVYEAQKSFSIACVAGFFFPTLLFFFCIH
jgi:hypothetical protein